MGSFLEFTEHMLNGKASSMRRFHLGRSAVQRTEHGRGVDCPRGGALSLRTCQITVLSD